MNQATYSCNLDKVKLFNSTNYYGHTWQQWTCVLLSLEAGSGSHQCCAQFSLNSILFPFAIIQFNSIHLLKVKITIQFNSPICASFSVQLNDNTCQMEWLVESDCNI